MKSHFSASIPRSVSILIALLAIGASLGCKERPADEHGAADPPAAGSQPTTEGATHAADDAEQRALERPDPAGTYGAGIHLDETLPLATLLANPTAYEGKTVRVEGEVTGVCAKRGCWIDVAESADRQIRVKVTDGEIVFPKSAAGHRAVVEGVVEHIELSAEEARAWKEHEAEELGKPFDPASVTGPLTVWRLQGKGARIES